MSVVYYEQPKQSDESSGGDFQQVLSFATAFAGSWVKSKLCIWLSLFLLLSSFATMKTRATNYMQLLLNFGLIVMGFLTLYVWIPQQELLLQQKMMEQQQEQQPFG